MLRSVKVRASGTGVGRPGECSGLLSTLGNLSIPQHPVRVMAAEVSELQRIEFEAAYLAVESARPAVAALVRAALGLPTPTGARADPAEVLAAARSFAGVARRWVDVADLAGLFPAVAVSTDPGVRRR